MANDLSFCLVTLQCHGGSDRFKGAILSLRSLSKS